LLVILVSPLTEATRARKRALIMNNNHEAHY